MEQLPSWMSFSVAYWTVAFWWVVSMALDHWLLTTIILVVLLATAMGVAFKEYLLYTSSPR